jgi:aquaporin Z
MKKYLTEFIGTFFLVFAVCAASGTLAPLAIGSTLMVMIFMGGHVSGAHYNPAVSLAVMLRGKLDTKDFIPYLVFQLLGAFAASAIAYSIRGTPTSGPAPGEGVGVMSALVVEILFTFALALVVLNVATAKDTAGNSFYGLAIGFTIVAAAVTGGPISGGAFNPAVGIAPNVMAGSLGNLWIYIVGPFAGGALAVPVFLIQENT